MSQCPYAPLPSTLIILDDRGPAQTGSGIYIPDSAKRVMGGYGEIVAVGEKIREFTVGQKVAYRKYNGKIIEEDDGTRYSVIKEEDVICLVNTDAVSHMDVYGFAEEKVDVWKSELAQENRRKMQRRAQEQREKLQERMIADALDRGR